MGLQWLWNIYGIGWAASVKTLVKHLVVSSEINGSVCQIGPIFQNVYFSNIYIRICPFFQRIINIFVSSFPELNNGLSSTEELSLYPENGYARYSHGGPSRWTEHTAMAGKPLTLVSVDSTDVSEIKREYWTVSQLTLEVMTTWIHNLSSTSVVIFLHLCSIVSTKHSNLHWEHVAEVCVHVVIT